MQVNIKKVLSVHSPRKQKIEVETVTDIRRAIAIDIGEGSLILSDVVNTDQVKKDDLVFVFRAGHTLNYRLARGFLLDRTLAVELEEPGTYVLLEDTFLPVKIVFPGGFKHPETKEKIRFDSADDDFDYAQMLGVGILESEESENSEELEREMKEEALAYAELSQEMDEVEFIEENTGNELKKSKGKKQKKQSENN